MSALPRVDTREINMSKMQHLSVYQVHVLDRLECSRALIYEHWS